jgi:hypothetical protein
MRRVSSDKPTGADNQQERPVHAQWVVGFVDGEGCFSVPISRSRVCSSGWQVQPTFIVVQGARSVQVLHELERFFGCGSVGLNGRHDNHREDLWRFCVRRLSDLSNRIIPFFEEHPLITAKSVDFACFVRVVTLMQTKRHLTPAGLHEVATLASQMNRRKPSRVLESSEAIRQPPSIDGEGEDMVRAVWRHTDNSSEIPCRVSSDLHEWRNDFPTVSTTDPAKLKYE